eukprot:scaffold131152_cov36-Tisochrysis_lutea.AAC.1
MCLDLSLSLDAAEAEAASNQRATQTLLLKVAEAVCDLDEQAESLRTITNAHAREIAQIRAQLHPTDAQGNATLERSRMIHSVSGEPAHDEDSTPLQDEAVARWQGMLQRITGNCAAASQLPTWMIPPAALVVGVATNLRLHTLDKRSLFASVALSVCIAALPRLPTW